jgi:hypothetical protein
MVFLASVAIGSALIKLGSEKIEHPMDWVQNKAAEGIEIKNQNNKK